MPDIDLDFMCHKLSILPQENPMAQRKCKFNEERHQSVDQEVEKLLKVDFIRKIVYTTWLLNVVMVKKSNGKWKICICYAYLDKVCPKDTYPLPSIDRLINNRS